MTSMLRWPVGACGWVALMLCLSSSTGAQVTEVDFRTLYAAAEYDKALEAIASLDSVEAQQYKALCLLALGRQADANTAIEALVNASPTFVPSSEDAPPRFVELVTKVRQKLLPVIARRTFADGRDRYTSKATGEALTQFSLVLTLLSDPAFTDAMPNRIWKRWPRDSSISRMRRRRLPSPCLQNRRRRRPPTRDPDGATEGYGPHSARTERPADAYGHRDPCDRKAGGSRPDRCDREGDEATVKESVHPRYDRIVTEAARDWRYTPATRDGSPIPSEQVVTVQPKR